MKIKKRIEEMKIDKAVLDEYKPEDNGIWATDSTEIDKLKHIIFESLSEPERIIVLLYAENPSQRMCAEKLGISVSLFNVVIKRIRNKIYDLL